MVIVPRNPELEAFEAEFEKWRYCFAGGEIFKRSYLERIHPVDETDAMFLKRIRVTPVGAFAAEGLLRIQDKIFQHFPQIRRLSGPESYQEAVQGKKGGVDFKWNSMDSFMGSVVLIELLLMGKVGVFVDMPAKKGEFGLVSDNPNHRPYLYAYRREDIINWVPDLSGDPNEFKSVLLRDYVPGESESGFPTTPTERFRRIFKEDGKVYEQVWDDKTGFSVNPLRGPVTPPRLIEGITKVPFVLMELSDSLMRRVADHQIAILNLESLDMNFLMKSNFPFYVEEGSNLSESDFNPIVAPGTSTQTDGTVIAAPAAPTIKVGTDKGRIYPRGSKPPQYIHASSESVKASIDKQEQLKVDIQRLLDLAVSQIRQSSGTQASGTIGPEVKTSDSSTGGLSGLAAISLVLETGEQKIANTWAAYLKKDPAFVTYPKKYESKSDGQRMAEAKGYFELIDKTPSITGQKAIAKEGMTALLADKVDSSELNKIKKEIDDAPLVQTDAATLQIDIQSGLVDPETASVARCYPEGSAEKAEKYQARRAAAIVVAQTKGMGHAANAQSETGEPATDNPAARGAPELSASPDSSGAAKGEKQQSKAKKKARIGQSNPGGNKADQNNKPNSGTR